VERLEVVLGVVWANVARWRLRYSAESFVSLLTIISYIAVSCQHDDNVNGPGWRDVTWVSRSHVINSTVGQCVILTV